MAIPRTTTDNKYPSTARRATRIPMPTSFPVLASDASPPIPPRARPPLTADLIAQQIEELKKQNARLKSDLGGVIAEREVKKKVNNLEFLEGKGALEGSTLGLGNAYVGTGDLREQFMEYEKVAAAKAKELAESAMRGPEAPVGTGVTPRPPPVFEKTENPMSIVFVSSEVAPWSKTGGLADVCGSLPRELVKRGHRVMVVSPMYKLGKKEDELYHGAFDTCSNTTVGCFDAAHEVGFFHQIYDGVDFVFVKHACYERIGGLYGDSYGVYGDNQFRFTLLSHAACEAPLVIDFGEGKGTYGDEVVFVANDWHAGLVPLLVASKYRPYGTYNNCRTITTIHNIMHQGTEPNTTFNNLGVPSDWYSCLEYQYPEEQRAHELDLGLVVNILKGAIATSDRVLTVSEGYAQEIQTPLGGKGLEVMLQERSHRLDGVVNGIDMDEWNPMTDPYTDAPFDVSDFSGKLECKRGLQREMGFEVRDDVPLMGFIGRLDWQKGPDLIRDAIHELMNEDVQLVMLGSGLPELEEFMQWAEGTYSEKFRGWVGFSVAMSHRITAGCDILLMPSRFEPCGLNQLYAMRYGTLPIGHATGGLNDTITRANPYADPDPQLAVAAAVDESDLGPGTGWLFTGMDTRTFYNCVSNACKLYHENPEMWRAMQIQAMSQDLSWYNAALKWEKVFEWAKIDPPHCEPAQW